MATLYTMGNTSILELTDLPDELIGNIMSLNAPELQGLKLIGRYEPGQHAGADAIVDSRPIDAGKCIVLEKII